MKVSKIPVRNEDRNNINFYFSTLLSNYSVQQCIALSRNYGKSPLVPLGPLDNRTNTPFSFDESTSAI